MFVRLLNFFLIVFSKFPEKMEAHRDEFESFIEWDEKIPLTYNRADSLSFDTFHESGEYTQQSFPQNSEKSRRREHFYDHSSRENSYRDTSEWHFGYQNIDEWGQYYPVCLGKRQSPINIDSSAVTPLPVTTPFHWTGYSTIPTNMTVVNNGHSIELSGSWNGSRPYISGGVLEGVYVFHQIHFHWGPHDDVGSEHTINNCSLPLDMHLVHYKKQYGSASEAMNHEDGLAVVGILFQIGALRSLGIAALQKHTEQIQNPGDPIQIQPFPLSILGLHSPDEYVTYLGSLTTPPCSEVVTWILPATPRYLTRSQLNNFRSIQMADGDDHNYRPTMPLNDRTIYYISDEQ